MAATKIGIVYATGSGMLRRWIVPDDDKELSEKHPVSPGETLLVADRATIKSRADIEAAVAAVTGKGVPSPRCVVVDALGDVEAVIMADPALDALPGKALMLHADAEPGWKVVAGVLTAPILDVQVDPIPAVNL